MKEMVVDIDKDGNIVIEVNGVKGSECLNVTKELEEKLGEVTKRDKKPDFYARIKGKTNQRIKR